jgi:hypothetical protein
MNSASITASFQRYIRVSTTKNESHIDVYGVNKRNEFSSVKRQAREVCASGTGRPRSTCDEFEEDVIAECESSLNSYSSCFDRETSSLSSSNEYTYALVKKCAAAVMEKEYWDEGSHSFVKKWQLNRTTSRLRFTNKWVQGVQLRRQLLKNKKKTSGGELSLSSSDGDVTTCSQSSSTCNSATSSDVQAQDTLEFNVHVMDADQERDTGICRDLDRDMCCDLDSSLTGSSAWTDDDLFLDSCFGFDFDWSL